MRLHASLASLYLAYSLAGCTSQAAAEPPRNGARAQTPQRAGPMSMCPMALPDAQVRYEEVPRGAALHFTTENDAHVQVLRERAVHLAQMHQHHVQMHARGGRRGMRAPGMMMMVVSSDVEVEETERGARVVFSAQRDEDVEALREEVQMRAARMQGGDCPMLRGQMRLHQREHMQPRSAPPDESPQTDGDSLY